MSSVTDAAAFVPQQFIWKFLNGTLTFIGLLVVLLGPALLFSSLNPTMTPNPVSGAEVTLGMSLTLRLLS